LNIIDILPGAFQPNSYRVWFSVDSVFSLLVGAFLHACSTGRFLVQLFLVFMGDGSALLIVSLLRFLINARSSGLIPMGINIRWCWGFLPGKYWHFVTGTSGINNTETLVTGTLKCQISFKS
jgi:hypothetical protein